MGRRVNDRQGSVQARETIAHYQADMSHPPVKEVSKDPFPARGALHGMVVNAEHFPFLVLFDTENHVKGFRGNRALPLDLDVDGIHENDRVIAFQGAIQPLLNVRAGTRSSGRCWPCCNGSRKLSKTSPTWLWLAPAVKDAGQAFALHLLVAEQRQDLGVKVAVAVAGISELQNTTLTESAAMAEPVTLVAFGVIQELAPLCNIMLWS